MITVLHSLLTHAESYSGIDTALPNAHENLTDGATLIDGSDGRRGLVERELRSYDWV